MVFYFSPYISLGVGKTPYFGNKIWDTLEMLNPIYYFPILDLAFENGFIFFFIILLEFTFDFGQLQSHLTIWL
jgi:hypothetical protein